MDVMEPRLENNSWQKQSARLRRRKERARALKENPSLGLLDCVGRVRPEIREMIARAVAERGSTHRAE